MRPAAAWTDAPHLQKVHHELTKEERRYFGGVSPSSELASAAYDLVEEVHALTVPLPAYDIGDGHLLAVDGSGSGSGPEGACSIIDGTGRASCFSFRFRRVGVASGLSYVLEALAAEAALRPFRNRDAVTLITDNQVVYDLVNAASGLRQASFLTPLDRDALGLAREVRRHCRRLRVTVQRDTTQGEVVAQARHMVAAHRFALGSLQLRVDGIDPRHDEQERDWLVKFAQSPGRNVKVIERRGKYHRQDRLRQEALQPIKASMLPLVAAFGERLDLGSLWYERSVVDEFGHRQGIDEDPEQPFQALLSAMVTDPRTLALVLPSGDVLVTLDGSAVLLDPALSQVKNFANTPDQYLKDAFAIP